MPEPLKLKDVEATFQMPASLANEVEVVDDGRTFIYRGCAHNLYLDGLNIRGAVSLEKVEKRTEMRKVKTGGFFSWQFKKEPVATEKRVWFVDTGREYNGRSHKYFVSDGQSKTSRDCPAWYRSALVGELATNKVLISDTLLDAVFSPIDRRLLEVYHAVKNFGGFPKN